jgi:SecD/SecF fusion protein
MLRRNLWKIIASAALVLWALFTTMPLQDRDFAQYVRSEATAKSAEFGKLTARVDDIIKQAKAQGRDLSFYVVLKQIAHEERIDLSQFFPAIKLEGSLKTSTSATTSS